MSSSQRTGVVIIGGGQAGVQLADSLRACDPVLPITIVTDEVHHPYQRPPLSKSLWGDDVRVSAVPLRASDFFDAHSVRLLAGVRAVAIDRDAKQVLLDTGESLPYAALVLATGARARSVPLEGASLPGVHRLRTLDDGLALQAALRSATSLLVIGGGFTGLEIAASATQHGLKTTVLEVQSRILERALTAKTAQWLADFHVAAGLDLRLSTTASAIVEERGRAAAVVTHQGERIPADVVVVGVGVVPNTDLASEAGLTVDNGIVVDATLRTDDAAIWAIGDSVRFPSHFSGGDARLESVQNATDHARAAAPNIIAALRGGSQQPYVAVPWFWSNQGAARLQIAGIGNNSPADVVVREYGDQKLSVFVFQGGRLTVVETVNVAADHVAARRIIADGGTLDRAKVEDPSVPIKSLIAR